MTKQISEGRKAWTEDQDHAIKTLVKKHGTHRWSEISKRMLDHFGTPGRSGKQCRERWHNHLNPKINTQPWSRQEENKLFQIHQQYGNKWKQISKQLQGRTDNDIKNKFYSSMRKKLRKINKLTGKKNSTSHVKQIKPKILSNILNDIQKTSPHLMSYLLRFDDSQAKNTSQEDKQLGIELLLKINAQNQQYLHSKDKKLKQLQDLPMRMTRSKNSDVEMENKGKPLVRLLKRASLTKNTKKSGVQAVKKIEVEKSGPKLDSLQDIIHEDEISFDHFDNNQLFLTPGITKRPSAFQQYSQNRNHFMMASPRASYHSPLGPSPSPGMGFGGALFQPKPSDFQGTKLNTYVDSLRNRMKQQK